MDRNGFEILPITMAAATSVKNLPAIHGDPFDRMMVAQAKLEGLEIISRDPIFESYGLNRIW
jgi:PIN domain nuclease of toxin-antitoxin system